MEISIHTQMYDEAKDLATTAETIVKLDTGNIDCVTIHVNDKTFSMFVVTEYEHAGEISYMQGDNNISRDEYIAGIDAAITAELNKN